MSSNRPSLPKGTRDFSPIEMVRRNYIFDTIKKVYKKYGFQQIETPAMENLSTLVGTGGDESDKLIFKILNSGDYLAKADEKALQEKNANGLTKSIAEKALHYDLTVPFARYVVQNQNEITFPFRRFQIQPVWRADRPQRGRYREFYQCDADIIGSDSLLNEVDLIKIIDDVFTELFQGKLNYTVSVNNRKILQGIVESVGLQDKLEAIVVAIDKFDKIGNKGVIDELVRLGINLNDCHELMRLILPKPVRETELEKIQYLNQQIKNTINGQKGIDELEFVFEKLQQLGLKTANVIFDPTLARGLGYYTGTIIEVKVDNFPSICGGGRYDDLTGKFGLKDVSGVGISFGADRIYDVLLDNNLYPEFEGDSTQVLFVNFGEKEQDYCLPLLFQLRNEDINAEIYPDVRAKLKKQMTFANNKNINYVVLVGSDEMNSGKLTVKNMKTGEQYAFTIEELIQELKK
ncbi:MAG: histidine--tRNA ligase [Flavobacteriales bacterium]|nr:histidine--tRNA ligase [Flavobacteriales bacterium]|tara:strand:- start:129514 stop:130899 length:1386 start_codon:yes stop_codon:yes gene_type:complete